MSVRAAVPTDRVAPRLLITLGDPAGIGPEVTAKALARLAVEGQFEPSHWLIVGNRAAFEAVVPPGPVREALMWLPLAAGGALEMGTALDELEQVAPPEAAPRLWALDVDGGARVQPGAASASGGASAWRALECALQVLDFRARRREHAWQPLGGLVTAPLSKAALQLAGADFLDHTTRLGRATKRDSIMAFVGGGLRVALATVHVPLAEVPARLEVESLARVIVRAGTVFARYERFRAPLRLAVCGLNPHAGEGGLIGDEEARIITPAIDLARHGGLEVSDPLAADGEPAVLDIHGPLPADTVFHRAREGEFDAVLAMYHDQALCAVKTLAFHEAVNVTLNLPFVRTSPDHGTAFDRAGRDIARADSMYAALCLARRYSVATATPPP